MVSDSEKKCLSCLECCMWIGFIVTVENTEEMLQLYRMRNHEIVRVEEKTIYMLVPSRCQYLSMNGCKIYHERPQICRRYDGRFDPLLKHKCKLGEDNA